MLSTSMWNGKQFSRNRRPCKPPVLRGKMQFDKEKFRNDLKEFMAKEKWSSRDIEFFTGGVISHSTVCNWANGEHFPKIQALFATITLMGKEIKDYIK